MPNQRLFFPLLAGLLFISGCNQAPSEKIICEQDPQLCRGLNQDGWCRAERSEVVLNEYYLKQQKTDLGIYHTLLAWEAYRDCIELAGHIELKRLKARQSQRIGGYIRAEEAISAYQKQTLSSEHPSLLWYQWSREGNKRAYAKFVALEESGQLNTPELVINIAAHYSEYEKERAIDYLLKALTMYDNEDDIDPNIYRRLTTLTYQLKDFRHSYMWALITKELDAGTVNLELINGKDQLSAFEKQKAQEIADYILSHLGEPEFKPRRSYAFDE